MVLTNEIIEFFTFKVFQSFFFFFFYTLHTWYKVFEMFLLFLYRPLMYENDLQTLLLLKGNRHELKTVNF